MEITVNRLKHILGVGKKMKAMVKENPEKFECSPDEAFVIGILHDVGYEFSNEQKEHAEKGGLILKDQGYKYWKEIFFHGKPQDEYSSKLLTLLNYADMTTGPAGESMTIKQRIDDIAARYGNNSIQVIDAKKFAEKEKAVLEKILGLSNL